MLVNLVRIKSIIFNSDNYKDMSVLIKPTNLNWFLFTKDYSRSCELE